MKIYVYEYWTDKRKFRYYSDEAYIKSVPQDIFRPASCQNKDYYFWQNDEISEPVEFADIVQQDCDMLYLYSEREYSIKDILDKFVSFQKCNIQHIRNREEREVQAIQKQINDVVEVMGCDDTSY